METYHSTYTDAMQAAWDARCTSTANTHSLIAIAAALGSIEVVLNKIAAALED